MMTSTLRSSEINLRVASLSKVLGCLLAGSFAVAQSASAASQTWTNAPVDPYWSNSLNWVGAAIPGATNSTGTADITTFNSPIPLSGFGGTTIPITNDVQRSIRSVRFDTADCGAYVFGSSVNDNSLWLTHLGDITINSAVTNPIVFNEGVRQRVPNSTDQRYDFTNNAVNPNATLFFAVISNATANTRPWRVFLGGSNTGTNTIARIDDANGGAAGAAGAILIDKVGIGTWVLSGANDLPQKTSNNGVARVQVIEGTLIVKDPASLGLLTVGNINITNTGVLQIDGIALNNAALTLRNGGTVRMNGTASLSGVTVGGQPALSATLRTTSAGNFFTIGTLLAANSIVSGGAVDSVLNFNGPGTIVLSTANTYLGSWSFNSGTNKIGDANALAAGPNVNIAAGAILDTTALGATTYALTTAGLSGNGTGTSVGSTAAAIVADPAGTIDLATGSKSITLTFSPTSFSGDTTHPSLYIAQGTLAVGGNSFTINNASGTPLGIGTYRIFQQGSGSITDGGGYSAVVTGSGLAAGTAPVILVSGGNVNLQVISATPNNLVWTGDGGANLWDTGTSTTWLNGATPSIFNYFDNANFNSVGLSNPIVNLVGTLLPSSVKVDTAGSTYTFAGTGRIGGSTGLSKTGSGTLLLQTFNTYLGTTAITNGALQLSVNNAIPTAGTVVLESTGILDLNNNSQTVGTLSGSGTVDSIVGGTPVLTVGNNSTNTFSGVIQGTVGLTKAANGSLTLNSANPYSGGTVVNAGTLVMGNVNSIGSGNSGLTINGGTLNLNNNNLTVPSLAGGGGAIGNSGTLGTNTLTVNEGNGNTVGMTIDENPSGAKTRLVLLGSTELRLGAANTYSGGTLVGSGAIFALNASGSAGTGPIVLTNNATFYLHNAGGPSVFSGNPVNVPEENATFIFNSGQEGNSYNGLVTAPATATNSVTGPISFGNSTTQQFAGFPGRVIVQSGATVRWGSGSGANNGGDNTTFELKGTMHIRSPGGTARLGALEGNGTINNVTSGAGIGTYLIGAKGITTTFSGSFTGSNGTTNNALTKVGAGSLTLDGKAYWTNTVTLPDSSVVDYTLFTNAVLYGGTTTVSNGTLKIVAPNNLTNSASITMAGGTLDVTASGYATNQTTLDINSIDQPTNSVAVTNGTLEILSGQSLNGLGTILGNVLADAGSTVNAGLSIGTLNISGSATINGTLSMELNRNNSPNSDRIVASAVDVNGATINVTNIGPDLVTGDVFQLFNSAVSGTPAAVNLPVQNLAATVTYVWTNMLAINGTIKVLSGASPVNPNPTNIITSLSGNQLTLSWPADHIGWDLQTNSVGVASSNSWFAYPGSATTNQVIVTIDPTKANVFYRLHVTP